MADSNRYRLKQIPTDVWSVRERLALASSVSRSGDQNWVSVSRAVRPFGMPNRPADWFSQKNCALQYSVLLENVETPRRKRIEREAVETPGDIIVRKLTIERIEELKKLIAKEAEEYKAVKKDLEAVRSGQCDGQIKEMWEKLLADKAAAAAAAAKAAEEELAARERAKAEALKSRKSHLQSMKSVPTSDIEDSTQDSSAFDPFINEDSNVSSVPTPGPSQIAETSVNVASPVSASFVSPKNELAADSSIVSESDAISVAQTMEVDEANDVKKIEIKQEEVVDEELDKKMEVSMECSLTVKNEEQDSVKDDDVPQEVNNPSADEVEVKNESPVTDKAESSFFEREEVGDDELIPFTPVDVPSPALFSEEDNVTEETTETVVATQDAEVEVAVEVSEETVVQPVPEVEEEQVEDVKESQDEKETEAENIEVEETIEQAATLQPEPPLTANVAIDEAEAPKTEDVADNAVAIKVVDPTSPTSSIVSTETVSVHGKKSARRGRRRKQRRIRKTSAKVQQHAEEGKESELSSKEGESSDEEASRVQPPENEDSVLLSSLPQHLDANESLPNSPASLSHSDTEDEKSYKVWKKSIMLVWRAATNHKCASVFLHPVTEDIAPGYHSVVHKPMDLQKIKRKIDNGEIRTTAEFQRDMMLMFTNAIMYNNSEHDVHKMAKNMYRDVMGHIEQFVSTQIMVQAEPKLLRTLRRTDAVHSDKEEETKRKRPVDPEQTPSSSGAKVKKRKL